MKIALTYDFVKSLYDSHGYPLEEGINVFGIRNSELVPDAWDDILGIIYNDEVICVSGTTDPGRSWLSKEGHPEGVFILKPGYYKNCWHRGKHHGKYKALVQFGDGVFKGWRDKNKDGKFDLTGKTYTNVKGLNFHTTRWDLQVLRVGDFSAGCQVVEVAKDYDRVIDLAYSTSQSLYSYALFNEKSPEGL